MMALICGIFAAATATISWFTFRLLTRTLERLRAERDAAVKHLAERCECEECIHDRLEMMAVRACFEERAPVLLEAFRDDKGEILIRTRKV